MASTTAFASERLGNTERDQDSDGDTCTNRSARVGVAGAKRLPWLRHIRRAERRLIRPYTFETKYLRTAATGSASFSAQSAVRLLGIQKSHST